MPVQFTIKASLGEVVRKMGQLKTQQQQDLKTDIDIMLLTILRDSKTKPPRVPVDTGALQASGFTEPAKVEGNKVNAAVGYGGAFQGGIVDYAVFVHDNLNGRIKNYKRPGSGPKFLETHWNNKTSNFKQTGEVTIGKSYSKL